MERATLKKPNFHDELKDLMDRYVHDVYRLARQFPREEQYASSAQLRRAALSVVLNYIEGYARFRGKVHKNFLEISYGSLQESKYLLDFSHKEGYLSDKEYNQIFSMAEEIGAMLWGILRKMNIDS